MYTRRLRDVVKEVVLSHKSTNRQDSVKKILIKLKLLSTEISNLKEIADKILLFYKTV